MEKCLSLRNQNPLPEEKNVKNVIIPKTCITKADASISPPLWIKIFLARMLHVFETLHACSPSLGLWCVLSTS